MFNKYDFLNFSSQALQNVLQNVLNSVQTGGGGNRGDHHQSSNDQEPTKHSIAMYPKCKFFFLIFIIFELRKIHCVQAIEMQRAIGPVKIQPKFTLHRQCSIIWVSISMWKVAI